jgi:limonene-1,2-epoxide hydrolase
MAESNESAVREVLAAWSEGIAAAIAATRKHFADDCVWEQSGMPTTTGPEEAAQLVLETMGFASADIEYRHFACVGNVVFTERIDWMVRTDGTRVGPVPVVGVTEFRDGKISARVLRHGATRSDAWRVADC